LQVAKIAFISALASLTAHVIAVYFAPLWGILCGGSASLIVLFVLMYLFRVLEPEDRERLAALTGMLPIRLAGPMNRVLLLLTRPGSKPAISAGV
jgi:hypothetical protein